MSIGINQVYQSVSKNYDVHAFGTMPAKSTPRRLILEKVTNYNNYHVKPPHSHSRANHNVHN